jgi:serine/threonine protein phosphatase PrpC
MISLPLAASYALNIWSQVRGEVNMLTAHRTDIGRIRTLNEDRVSVQEELNGFTLAIVADGMGGHQAGDIASQMAIETIQGQLQELHTGMSIEECEAALKHAIYKANDEVFHRASTELQYQGMGTTVVLALASEEKVILANIGDSRAYMISDESIKQITEDHSLVTELVKSGQISAEEAHAHPRRNVLTRALGTDQAVTVDIYQIQWNDGDSILLCSDGLSGLLDNERIKGILSNEQNIHRKTDLLIASALEAGGEDNITVALLSNVKELAGERGEII